MRWATGKTARRCFSRVLHPVYWFMLIDKSDLVDGVGLCNGDICENAGKLIVSRTGTIQC